MANSSTHILTLGEAVILLMKPVMLGWGQRSFCESRVHVPGTEVPPWPGSPSIRI